MIAITIGRAAQFLLALVMLRLATTLLSPEEMGKVSLTLTSAAFFAMFLINPVGMFINRRLHAWQNNGRARPYLVRYTGYLLLVALTAAISIPLIALYGHVNFGMATGWVVTLVCCSLLFNTINQTSIPAINLLGEHRWFVILTVATLACSLLFALILVELFQPQAQYWLLGVMLGQMLLGIAGTGVLFAMLRQGGASVATSPVTVQRQHLTELFKFAWPVVIAAGLAWVQGQSYRYILENGLGLAQVGLFVAGYGVSAGIIAGAESVLTAYFQPRLYRDANTSDVLRQGLAWRRYAAAVIPSLMLTVSLLISLAPELTRVLLGAKFQSASDYLIWGALAEGARVLAGAYSLIAHVFMRTKWLIVPNMVGAALSVMLCFALLPMLGAHGAGLALACSGLATVILMHLALARRVQARSPVRSILLTLSAALGLWGLAWLSRVTLHAVIWVEVLGTLSLTGLAFLTTQYLLLRRHLGDVQ
ncbi:lipopolysaccharide biosynthesis protein [Leeia sp.]|uniref:lipopolysaccharide biosynthesis protein n=1 Tax=Leeia sp. TaxID=2884678 RepID=UPI0035B1CF75